MFGMVASMGWPFSPWHELQIWSFASRLSAALAGAASAAKTAATRRVPRRVGTRFLIMFTLPLLECLRSRDARGAGTRPKHAAVRRAAQAGRTHALWLDDCTAANDDWTRK